MPPRTPDECFFVSALYSWASRQTGELDVSKPRLILFVNVTCVTEPPTMIACIERTEGLMSGQRSGCRHVIDVTVTPAGTVGSVTSYRPSSNVASRHSPAGTLSVAVVGSPGLPTRLIPPALNPNGVPGAIPTPATLQTRSVPNVERFVYVAVVVDAPTTWAWTWRTPRLTSEHLASGSQLIADAAIPATGLVSTSW